MYDQNVTANTSEERDNDNNQASQHWTVHAEFTISHDGLTEQGIGTPIPPTTHTEQDENGAVRLVYRWTCVQSHPTVDEQSNTVQQQPIPTRTSRSSHPTPTSPVPPPPPLPAQSKGQPGYVWNLRNKYGAAAKADVPMMSSGYSSEQQLLSPRSSFTNNGGCASKLRNPCNQRCRSTCSIVLSTNVNAAAGQLEPCAETDVIDGAGAGASTARTQSLRCQTPKAHQTPAVTNKREYPPANVSSLYGCGDPWCHHSPNYDDYTNCRSAPLIDTNQCTMTRTAQTSGATSIKSTKTTSNNKPDSIAQKCCKDASVQTYEMVDKCTSPFLFDDHLASDQSKFAVCGKLNIGHVASKKRPAHYVTRRKTEPIRRTSKGRESDAIDMSALTSPHNIYSKQYCVKRFVQQQQQQQRVQSSYLSNQNEAAVVDAVSAGKDPTNLTEQTKPSDNIKEARTVHIDVYCTGTEHDSSCSSSTSSTSTSTSTDSNNHNDADNNNNNNDDVGEQSVSSPQTVFESSDVRITHTRADAKGNVLPNRILRDQKQQQQQQVASDMAKQMQDNYDNDDDDDDMTSTAYPSQVSSYSAIRDVDVSSFSTNPWSRMSLSSCDTTTSDMASLLDGIGITGTSRKRGLYDVGSITEMPEQTTDSAVTAGDGDAEIVGSLRPSSFDSFEYAASEDKIRIKRLDEDLLQWRSPQVERQRLLNRKTVHEERKQLSDDSEGSDESGNGWTFVKSNNLKRDDTVKQRQQQQQPPAPTSYSLKPSSIPFKSPSVLIVTQKLIENPALTAPFTQSSGVFSDQRQIARRFGHIIDVYRKPGHHIGPAKNPDCTCNHCTDYFRYQQLNPNRGGFSSGRGRTHSVGSEGAIDFYTWKRRNVGIGIGRGQGRGRGSEPPQSQDEIRLQLEQRDDGTNTIYGLTRNASLSNI